MARLVVFPKLPAPARVDDGPGHTTRCDGSTTTDGLAIGPDWEAAHHLGAEEFDPVAQTKLTVERTRATSDTWLFVGRLVQSWRPLRSHGADPQGAGT